MSTKQQFNVYSAQTGRVFFGQVNASNERDACDKFAQLHDWPNAKAMWAVGRFEYIAAAVAS